ncbi:MAG: hypothetical protein WA005_03660 [Candidatus Binataceae bacterium]
MDPVECLLSEFENCLDYCEQHQYTGFESHLRTMTLRNVLANAGDAIDNDEFLTSLHKTLSDWGLRRAELVPLDEFKTVLRQHKQEIQQLEQFAIETVASDRWSDLWSVIESLKITSKRPRLVSGTKVLHHILPNLVVPVDRVYTATFLFAYQPHDFQPEPNKSGQCERETFRVAFQCFSRVASAIGSNVADYRRRNQIHTSVTKLIDNAIFAFVERTRTSTGGGAWIRPEE